MNTIFLRILSSVIATVLIGCAPQPRPVVQPPQTMTGQQSAAAQPPGDQPPAAQPQQLSPEPPAVQPPQTATGQQTTFVSNQPPADEVTPDPWPKTVKEGSATFTLYQPQLDNWDGHSFEAHAAGSVLAAGSKDPDFGAIEITANTQVDRLSRTVHFSNIQVNKVNFPSSPNKTAWYQDGFQKMVAGGVSTMSLDRLQAMLSIENALKMGRSVPVKNDPPKIIFSPRTAVLVAIDGEPVWRSIAGTSLERVINTRSLILLDDKSGKYYIHLFNGFVVATNLAGPWTLATQVPKSANQVAQELAKQRVVDLMTGPPDKKLSLKGAVPNVIVTTSPTELIVTDGAPDWAPLQGTNLLYVKNTTGNVFKDLNDQNTYVLVTGRWFRALDSAGPWQYVPGLSLPSDFSKIPDDSAKENVKASIPATPQAQETVIANEIPQTATVDRTKAKFTPVINGAPDLKPIPDTSLMYVFNSPMPIIMVSQYEWYGVENGVWFTASSAQGPWVVATSIPAAIYSIPPSSPLYYVTYVKIYDATPQYVAVGYTPGYMGTVVTTDGVVVYGTGYNYVPYIGTTVWYPPPLTYGYAANPTWTPWTGWAFGLGFGWAMGAAWGSSCCWGYAAAPYWGAMPYGGFVRGPYGGAAAWGLGGWAATTGNVYSHWGTTTAVSRGSAGYNAWTGNAWASRVGTSYNSVTGRVSAGQRAGVQNVYTGNYAYGQRGATYNPRTGVSARGGSVTYGNAYTGQQQTARGAQVTGPRGQTTGAARVGNDYYADHDGNVYKDTGAGWQKYDNGSWNNVQDTRQTQSLNTQQQERQWGDQRSASSSWGSRSWGGGFSGLDSGARSGGSFDGGGGFGGVGGGWNRGNFGGFSGGRSWGGGGFGGFGGGFGGFRGGGFRR
jgi:hypothetical protein